MVINIDGKDEEWNKFKQKFKDERDADLKEKEFILNINKPDERRIFWHYRSGFE